MVPGSTLNTSPPERPHQFRVRKDMTFHGRIDILAMDWGAQV
jgi:hypothetical protein